jgi:hypothetical protein
MKEPTSHGLSRRRFIRTASVLVAGIAARVTREIELYKTIIQQAGITKM